MQGATVYTASYDTTTSALKRQLDAKQRQRLQLRQFYDDDDDTANRLLLLDYYNGRLGSPRPASVCGFRDVSDKSDDDIGLRVQRITVGPF